MGGCPQGKLDGHPAAGRHRAPRGRGDWRKIAKTSRVHHATIARLAGSAPAAKAARVRAYRCRRSSARSVLRSPDPQLGGQGNSIRQERHSADQGFPRSANHHSPHRPQLSPSRKGQFEWDAKYVRVRWAVTRRPCVASPGAIAFAGGEAPRRYLFSGFGGSAPPAPNSRLHGDCTDSADRNKAAWQGNGRRPDTRAGPIRGAGRPPIGVQASVGVFLAAVASYGSRIKSVDLVISCPSRDTISRCAAGTPRAYAPCSFATSSRGVVDFAKRPPLVGGDVRTGGGSKRLG